MVAQGRARLIREDQGRGVAPCGDSTGNRRRYTDAPETLRQRVFQHSSIATKPCPPIARTSSASFTLRIHAFAVMKVLLGHQAYCRNPRRPLISAWHNPRISSTPGNAFTPPAGLA